MKIEPFNNQADAWLSDMLDRAEDKMVREGQCPADQASEVLMLQYIVAVAGIIRGGTQYLLNDEIIGAGIFLNGLRDARYLRWSGKRQRMCELQMAGHTHVYFPNYHTVLQATFRHVLQSTCGHGIDVTHSGILLLASTTLPGARSEIRRELRCRNIDFDLTMVGDELMNDKQREIETHNQRTTYLTKLRIK